MSGKTLLSVNVNKIATIRNARGGDEPNVLFFSRLAIDAGAHGITVHPRPDERHIRKQDVFELQKLIASLDRKSNVEFNIEGYPSEDFLQMIDVVRPDQVTLVPDPPHVITSNAGWNLEPNQKFLHTVVERIKKAGSRVSLFMDPHEWTDIQKNLLDQIRPDRVELYTESYAKAFGTSRQSEVLKIFKSCADDIISLGIGLNAGHDLSQKNLGLLIQTIPQISEVSIGHALISESLVDGMTTTVKGYLRILQ